MFISQNKIPLLFVLLIFLGRINTSAQLSQCKAILRNDTLTVENSKIGRTFLWNGGALKSLSLHNKITGQTITGNDTVRKGDVYFPGAGEQAGNGAFRTYDVPATASSYAYRAAEVTAQFGGMEVKRIFKLYADCPAIACDYYLRGKPGVWKLFGAEADAFRNIEDNATRKASEAATLVTDRIAISGKHWQVKSVEFFDATDYNNNLVQEYSRQLYGQDNRLRGNILLVQNSSNKMGFFILKEAPVSSIQLYHQGFDFIAKWGEIKCVGLGISPQDLKDSSWVKGYSVVVGINEGDDETGLSGSLRSYQIMQRMYKEERDAMIVANTWGDRNRDSRINQTFILQELDAAAKLGVTHFQIDDGWQVGVSSNSAKGGSLQNIWRNPAYWNVDTTKFPGGFTKVLNAAKARNIRLTLWFNPSTDSSFINWEKDAAVLIAQYKKYGITQWKIDGVQAADKQAEINFRKFLDKVMEATSHQAVFNLDVTAGRRFGYHQMYEYGNLFLENRYTDWGNYYPHFTLRNLWQLSLYLPPQRLQIEFLNKWRNTLKYPYDDKLAPATYSFDYLFAISMVAQPLAWFEVSGLPKEAFATSKLVQQYKTIAADLHKGKIFPIGDEPGGFGWTGFQSVQENRGYFLIFREDNRSAGKRMATYLAAGKKITLKLVAGEGKNFVAVTGEKGGLSFQLQKKRSFALYQYTLSE